MTLGLTVRQQEILDFIREEVMVRGYPPSFREVAKQFGIKSTNGVKVHLDALERKGYIRRDPGLARGIELTDQAADAAALKVEKVPIVGRVAAGSPILAEENLEGHIAVDGSFIQTENVFSLRVRGDSMVNAGIYHGDFVFAKKDATIFPGDIVVAVIGDEATVKRYYRDEDHIRLEPENDAYGPIIIEADIPNFSIAGKVTGVLRNM
ncbi:transcriptional repressor LexA [candidate division KSB1 bacterium]